MPGPGVTTAGHPLRGGHTVVPLPSWATLVGPGQVSVSGLQT